MIKINNKIFEKFISDVEIENSISRIANEISSLKIENPIFLCVLNGSFIFASDLVRKINQNIEVSFIKISSYIGTKSTGTVKELIGLKNDIKKRNIIIVEDIVDTGTTLSELFKILKKLEVKSIRTATLLYKPDSFHGKIPIDFIGFSITSRFVIGYGLDYDEIGRNLPHIYKLKY
ncbi:MAG: hypoxanthine phosphoribosyltransferase [Flavobacteriales bacterium TMED84]|nr:MAG: hypoxanthine phosphoribosyltransferase [Flavobacteriales bacterium TMED84]|tara:strand:+ start:1703 stop:2230 length:528 start_codon:yes stop_codon:yes gene_type:complete